jgi:hypothetical protein
VVFRLEGGELQAEAISEPRLDHRAGRLSCATAASSIACTISRFGAGAVG